MYSGNLDIESLKNYEKITEICRTENIKICVRLYKKGPHCRYQFLLGCLTIRKANSFSGFHHIPCVYLTMLQQCSDVNSSSQRILPIVRRSRDDSTQMAYFNRKKGPHCWQFIPGLPWSPNVDEVHSRFAEIVFKNILPATASCSSIFLPFPVFFNRKTLNNFSGKQGFSDLYLQKAVFQQRRHVQSSSQAHLKRNFMYFYHMVSTPYRQHGPLSRRHTHI